MQKYIMKQSKLAKKYAIRPTEENKRLLGNKETFLTDYTKKKDKSIMKI